MNLRALARLDVLNAMLFWWKDGEVPHPDNGRLHDRLVVSGDHFEAMRRSGASWEIVKAN